MSKLKPDNYLPVPIRKPYEAFGACSEVFEDMHSPEILISGPAGTGKSRAILEKIYKLAMDYPGMRALIVRKVKADVPESLLVEWEENVLGLDHPIVANGPQREYRRRYKFANGSEVVIGGMDRPKKVLSTQWDIVFIGEAIELEEQDYEIISTRLRNGKIWDGSNGMLGQIVCDTNPDIPTHWLKVRADTGNMRYLESDHTNNPIYYDQVKKTWTTKGAAYIAMLDRLSGARKQRYRFGKWARAEGAVLEEFDATKHVLTRQQLVERGLLLSTEGTYPRLYHANISSSFCVVDWGFRKPGVMNVFIRDKDGNLYRVFEVYMTERKVSWWKAKAKRIHEMMRVNTFICDPSEPGNIEELNSVPGIRALKAYNDIMHGINTLKEYLSPLDHPELPKFFILDTQEALEMTDIALKESKQPFSSQQEIDSYVWRDKSKKEEPVDEYNHGIDTFRYAVCYNEGYGDRPKRAGAWGRR